MSGEDHNDDGRKPGRKEDANRTRDDRGRWLPGHCPNPKGRPRKKSKQHADQSDLRIFAHTLVDFVVNGQTETMDRRTALLNKMFESAMKGRVSMQRFLYQEFEKNAEQLAQVRNHYDSLLFEWIIDPPDGDKPGFKIPAEVEVEITELRALLNHYFPGQYPDRLGSMPDDDDEDGD